METTNTTSNAPDERAQDEITRKEGFTNVRMFAQNELDILLTIHPDPNNPPIIEHFRSEILSMCEKFGRSGQSGGSAPYTAHAVCEALKKLLLFEPIAPITGEADEWGNVRDAIGDGKSMYQNKRCSALFKDGLDGNAYYIDAIVKRLPNGGCWSGSFWKTREDYLTGNRDLMVDKRCYVKSFPFTPKTFFIDVIEEEIAKDDWEMWMKDPAQLDEVYEYYDKF